MNIKWIILSSLHILQSSTKPGDISKKKCQEYSKAVYAEEDSPVLFSPVEKNNVSQCGIVEVPLIIGGTKAAAKEFPHMAVIGFEEPNCINDENCISWECGGSLISEQYVLTAAHCLRSPDRGSAKWVRLGDLNLEEEDDDAEPQQVEIIERIKHPDYKPPSKYNDIALLKLKEEIIFSGYTRPACLHTEYKIPGKKGIASGFGRTDNAKLETSKDLMKVQLSFTSMDQCNVSYRMFVGMRLLRSGITDSVLCAGESEGGKDTCQGDSGGPLQIVLEEPYCMYSIVGVTSFGVQCAYKTPAVYSRVSYFVPWIESVVWPS